VISCLQSPTTTVDTVDEMIHSRLQSETIQGETFRSIVDDDPVDEHPSEKIEDENVTDCVKFIRSANCKRLPNLILSLGAVLKINFCWCQSSTESCSTNKSLISQPK
jgi:hypothetical protein